MCGVAGWISSKRSVKRDTLAHMIARMEHRGPDGSGMWVSELGHVGLAHKRLAIIDRSELAGQPMRDSRLGLSISFNGEIYNHRELRKLLEDDGVAFVTSHSDTEVLLRGYSHWGMDGLLPRLNGMFAFALVDEKQNRAHIVRDRMGIKPMYFVADGPNFCFASEIKALLAHPTISAELDHQNLWHFMLFRSLPAPHTLFKRIQKVSPGAYLTIDLRTAAVTEIPYWDPLDHEPEVPGDESEARESLDSLLKSSVDYRLEADTPIGVFLSGGLDSSYILHLAHKAHEGLFSFTVGYEGHDDYDESVIAAETAARYSTKHHRVDIDDHYFSNILHSVAYHQDEPIAAPVCGPFYALSEAARSSDVPVILTGEGSDEIFVGYKRWLQLRDLQRLVHLMPSGIATATARTCNALAHRMRGMGRVSEVLNRISKSQPVFQGGAMDFTVESRRRISGPALDGFEDDTFDFLIKGHWDKYLSRRDKSDITGWMSYIDSRFRLPELMLPRLDKMGMAHAIEGRVPFLDHRIVEFAISLPPKMRAERSRVGKPLFKSLAAECMDRGFVYQTKKGFRAPVAEWKSGALGERFIGPLMNFCDRTGLFNRRAVERILAEKGSRLYFTLINIMIWHEIYIENTNWQLESTLTPKSA